MNGTYVGMKICPPYRFDVSGYLKAGVNNIRIELATTAAHKVAAMTPDSGPWAPPGKVLAPVGIIGSILFLEKRGK